MEKNIKVITVFILILISFYLAIAGWVGTDALIDYKADSNTNTTSPVTYGGLTFKDKEALEIYRKQKKASSWFFWLWEIPVSAVFVAAAGFGLLGGSIRLAKKSILGKLSKMSSILFTWLVAGAIGIILFFIIQYFIDEKSKMNLAIILFALLGGLFSEETYNWLETKLTGIFDVIFSKKN